MSTTLYQGWNHRYLGVATLEFSDSGGGPYTISIDTTINGGRLSHLDLSSIAIDSDSGGTLDLEFHSLASELQTLMQAAGDVPGVTYSQVANQYEIDAITNLTFPATAAGTLMRRLLGFSASPGATTNAVSDIPPRFTWRATINGRAQYDQPAMVADQRSVRATDSGPTYTLGPVNAVREARWSHQFEAKEHIHRRFAPSSDVWTAESFMDHASTYAVPCVIADDVESMVFYTGRGWTREAFARSRPDSDLHQIVRVNAERIVGYLP